MLNHDLLCTAVNVKLWVESCSSLRLSAVESWEWQTVAPSLHRVPIIIIIIIIMGFIAN